MDKLTRRTFLGTCLGAGGAYALGAAPADAGGRLSVADFGVLPDGADAAPGLRAALARLPAEGGVLSFPTGRYRFAAGTQGVAFNRLRGFTLEGNGSEFVFAEGARGFAFGGARAPTLRAFSIEWERPPFSQGDVVRMADDRRSGEVAIDAACPLPEGQPVHSVATYDRGEGLPARDGIEISGEVTGTESAGPGLLRLRFAKPLQALHPGQTVILRHQVYGTDALSFEGCSGVAIQDVTVHSAPGMALRLYRCDGARLQGFRVTPRPGTGLLMSTTADAMHFRRCRGTIEITDCLAQGMGDDGVNCHGDYFRLVERTGPRAGTFARHPPGGGVRSGDLPGPDSPVQLVSGKDFRVLGEGILTRTAAGPLMVAEFTDDLPAAFGPGDLLFEPREDTRLRVVRTEFIGNRARGILAHANVTVEGCTFRGQTMGAIHLAPDAGWLEGPAVRAVLVQNNVFERCNRYGRGDGVISIDATAAVPDAASAAPTTNGDVAIVGNRIASERLPALTARAVTGLRIEDNKFSGGSASACIRLQAVADVVLRANTSEPALQVIVDDASRGRLTLEGNRGVGVAPARRD